MKTSTKRILSIGLSGLFFMAALLNYGALIRPEIDSVSEKRAVILSKENLFNSQRSAVSGVQKLISQFQSIAKLQETVSLAMPLGENTTQAVNQWQAILKATQVNVRTFSIKPQPLESSRQALVKRLGRLALSISIQAPYENIKNFLRALETNVRVANIRSFGVTPITGSGGVESYSLTLEVEMYYQE